jgi:3-deoxy-D-manno-octulosonic-acid transferase
MLMLAYSALLTAALVLSCPWWLTRMITTARYREGLKQRLGFVPAELRQFAEGHRIVWLHAVSVGEVLAASRLIAELGSALGEGWRVVISTTTRTGQALARERFGQPPQRGAGRVFYMPLDFAYPVRAYLRALQPAALILMESELWPRLLHECEARGIPVAVVNARISDRSYRRAKRARAVWSHVLRKPTLWLAQSEEDARRLRSLIHSATVSSTEALPTSNVSSTEAKRSREIPAFPAARSRNPAILTTGNLKYDIRAPKQSRIAELIREAAAGRPIIVAGSTVASTEANVEDEEAQMIEGWMKGALPFHAVLVLAPRHPERFEKAFQIAFKFPVLKASSMLAGQRRQQAVCRSLPDGHSLETMDIVLLDTIGDLAALYGIADIAYVGGSLLERGGHNPLEPAQFGVPVLMGASYENFREIVTRMIEANAIRIVRNELELGIALKELLSCPDEARALGERGRAVFEQQQGATARTVAAILTMIERATP